MSNVWVQCESEISMRTPLVLCVFLLYFWYMTWFDTVSVPKPTGTHLPLPSPSNYTLKVKGSKFQFVVNSTVEWEDALPTDYSINQYQQLTQHDVCQNSGGKYATATGKPLYEYLFNDKIVKRNQLVNFETDAYTTLQDKPIFYFNCKNGFIKDLEMCPSGYYFTGRRCKNISICENKKDGVRLAEPFDSEHYYICEHGEAIRTKCPPNTFFVQDQCRAKDDMAVYCEHDGNPPKVLGPDALLVCNKGQATIEKCDQGYRYFDSPKCESDLCVGKANNTLIPLPNTTVFGFTFSPGYLKCFDEKVIEKKYCPSTWDTYTTNGDNMTHLPLVFNGKECAVPEMCTNVQSDLIVPVHEFTKHVSKWSRSKDFDQVTGYECVGNTRKRVALDPGQKISKHFKRTLACKTPQTKVVVSDQYDKYFDCQTNSVQQCSAGTLFNGEDCSASIFGSHAYKGLPLFKLDSLGYDNWIQPLDYDNTPKVEPCADPAFIYNENYNICSHPDCVHYPFLSQIDFKIKLRDYSKCQFDPTTREVKKLPTMLPAMYWSQRKVATLSDEECTPGMKIQSGDFAADSTIYATCQESQPFVFCPSSSTVGLELVDDKRYACAVPGLRAIVPERTTVRFHKNEVHKIRRIANVTRVKMNKSEILIPLVGLDPLNDNFTLQTFENGVEIEYKTRSTYPLDVMFEESGYKYSSKGGAFLTKVNDFTYKRITAPNYKIEYAVPDFRL